jgi:hypothetical protein
MAKQPKRTQTASQLSRTLSGQMSKQEKRSVAFVAITRYRQQAVRAVKAMQQARFL